MALTSLIDFRDQKDQIGNYIKDNLNYLYEDEKNELNILYLGVHFTEQVLFPYLEKLFIDDETTTVNLDIIINEVFTPTIFGNSLTDIYICIDETVFPKCNEAYKKQRLKSNISLENIDKCKIDKYSINFPFNEPEKCKTNHYNIIFCLFEFHRSINWRISFVHIFNMLCKDGALLFAEVNGSIELLDGNFKNSNSIDPSLKDLKDMLLTFDQDRQSEHFWRPEISSSNYKVLANQISFFFNSVIGYTGDTHNLGTFEKNESTKLKQVELLELINERKTSYFQIGLNCSRSPSKSLDSLISKFNSVTNSSQIFSFDSKLKLYISLKKRNDIIPKNLNMHNWNFNSLFNNLHELYCENLSEFGKKAIDVFLTHSIVVPEFTKLMTIITYLESEVKDLAKPIYTCVNLNGFDKNINKKPKDKIDQMMFVIKNNINNFLSNEEKEGNFALKTIFKNQKDKSNIKFKRVSNGTMHHENILYSDLNFKLTYLVSRNRNNRVIEIEIAFEIFAQFNYKDSISLALSDYRKQKETNQNILYCEVSNNVYKLIYEESTISVSHNSIKDGLFKLDYSCFDESNIRELMILLSIKDRNEFINLFYNICISFFYDSNSVNHTLNFYPSTIAVKGSEGNKEYEGLGGCILYGKSNYPDWLSNFIQARDKAISEASNILLYKASVISRKDFRKNSRKAAIAAITSRNISHNIGSHVIPNVKSSNLSTLSGLLDNEMKGKHKLLFQDRRDSSSFYDDVNRHITNYKYLYDEFLNYLQQRTDFVNQLTSGYGRWDISAWFVREVMAKFYKQKLLLDNIGLSEGLSSYDYSINKNIIHGKITRIGDEIRVNNEFVLHKTTIENIIKAKNIKESDLFEIFDSNINRSFRFTGITSNGKLKNGNLLDGKIIIQIRRRIFKIINLNTGDWDEKETSSKLGEPNTFDLHKYLDIQDLINRIDSQFDKIYLYAIVRFTQYENSYLLSNGWIINIKNKHPPLRIGTRIIVEVDKVQLESQKLDKNKTFNVDLIEFTQTVHVISTNPEIFGDSLINNDIRVSIPGGIAGYQAFYTILENIIRNAIKHNWAELSLVERVGQNLEVKIEYSKSSKDDCYYLKIWTNLYKDDKDKNMSKKINGIFQEDIIDSEGNFFKKVLGSVEMKINAAYISDVNANLTDSNYITGPNVILDDKEGLSSKGYIRSSNIFEKEGRNLVEKLGCRLKISKPDDITLFYKNQSSFDSEFTKTLKKTECTVLDNNSSPVTSNSDLFILYDDADNYSLDNFIIDHHIMVDDIGRLDFVKYFFYFEKNKVEKRLLKLFVGTLINIIDKLPFRIIYVSEIEIYKTLLSISKHPSLFNSIRHRIVFCRKSVFLGINDPIDLHYELRLYWLKIHFEYISEFHKVADTKNEIKKSIPKQYTLTVNINEDEEYYPTTMPTTIVENAFIKINEDNVFNRNPSIENLNVRYVRHDTSIKTNDASLTHLSGKMPSFQLFSILREDSLAKRFFKIDLLESGLIRYLIIDERLSNYFYNLTDNNIINRYLDCGIIIPNNVELNYKSDGKPWYLSRIPSSNFNNLKSNKFIRSNIEFDYFFSNIDTYKRRSFNTVIIHQSILETLFEPVNILEKNEVIKEFFFNLRIIFPSVIITSGRNRSILFEDIKFIPFTIIEEFIMSEYPDKISLTNNLLNTKTPEQ